MVLVVDANVLFAAPIRQNVTSDLLFRDDFHLYAPEFLFEEFEKYRNVIIAKTGRTDADIATLVSVLQRRIVFIPQEEIKPFLLHAQEFSPDEQMFPILRSHSNCIVHSGHRIGH
ncbi:MAG: hypothetical protein HY832_00255 [Candidatus Aenigmarchaeota archaeon]|nr:hypothetical protein [Candidatus Aenigmarchaeota archaeon]